MFRSRLLRPGLATAVGLLAFAVSACGGGDQGAAGGDAAGGPASGNEAAGGGALAPIGDPRAPLPAPAASPGGERAVVATSLATQVRGGGEAGAAALLTALRLSGIGVRGPAGQLAVDPVRPAQGTIVEAWEVRPLVALAREGRTVLIPLEELGTAVRAALPALADAPVEQMMLDGIRRHASDSASPLAFWATFVNALGGSHADVGEVDLVSAEDPKQVVVNGLQASLLLRRLATDLLVLAHPPSEASAPFAPLRWLAPKPLHAATASKQCQLTETQQAIMDVTAYVSGVVMGGVQAGDLGYPGLIGWMKDKGVAGAAGLDRFTKGAGVLLAYLQFIETYGALEAEIELDQGSLPRTKAMRPQTGERRNLVGVVRFTSGDEAAVNCFRIMLNAVGLDFSVPQDGPVKGAKVAWVGVSGFNEAAEALHGGPEAIVQFVADPATRIQDGSSWRFTSSNAVINQTADDEGVVRLGVEGRGQRKPVPAGAGRVVKDATVRLQVAVKGADLLGDMKDASSTAMGGVAGLLAVPVELLYRMKWASVATRTFPVLDWGVGKGWTGWVDVTVRASGGTTTEMPPLNTRVGRFTNVKFDFTNGVGSWSGTESVVINQTSREPCVMTPKRTSGRSSGSGRAWLQVGEEAPGETEIPEDEGERSVGNVDIGYDAQRTGIGITGIRMTGTESGTRTECDPNLRPLIVPHTDETGASYFPLGTAYGSLPDPMKATTLRGTFTSPYAHDAYGLRGTITVKWNLRRTR